MFRESVSAILLMSVIASASPAKPNVSADFAKAALKTLFSIRDGSDIWTDDLERAEVASTTKSDEEIIEALKMYQLSISTLSQADAMVEQAVPGRCFVELKMAIRTRVWNGNPPECTKLAKH